jgi:hypothetical protein
MISFKGGTNFYAIDPQNNSSCDQLVHTTTNYSLPLCRLELRLDDDLPERRLAPSTLTPLKLASA